MLPYLSQLRQAALHLGGDGGGGLGGLGPWSLGGSRLGLPTPLEEPKPQHSYIGLIAMAILSTPERKMVLSDIYQWILDNYPYFRTRGPGWRNSIRHNLSLNECFIKSSRSANGKGHYWAIHTANVDDFLKGDFRRRRAQRKVRKHNGLAVPDDEDDSDDSHPPTPAQPFPLPIHHPPFHLLAAAAAASSQSQPPPQLSPANSASSTSPSNQAPGMAPAAMTPSRKRQGFDVESLLASPAQLPKLLPFPAQLWPFGAFRLSPAPAAAAGHFPASPGVQSQLSPSPGQPDLADAAQWQETFAKIMARSYAQRSSTAVKAPQSSPDSHHSKD